eukprot:1002161-Pleurochrysis_carterae.AAC.2
MAVSHRTCKGRTPRQDFAGLWLAHRRPSQQRVSAVAFVDGAIELKRLRCVAQRVAVVGQRRRERVERLGRGGQRGEHARARVALAWKRWRGGGRNAGGAILAVSHVQAPGLSPAHPAWWHVGPEFRVDLVRFFAVSRSQSWPHRLGQMLHRAENGAIMRPKCALQPSLHLRWLLLRHLAVVGRTARREAPDGARRPLHCKHGLPKERDRNITLGGALC